ncbi:MAG: YciK family oxidoreductase [Pseudomonadota bacterium]
MSEPSQITPIPIPLRDFAIPDGYLLERRILVSGAGDGIGRAVALAAARAGAAVILLGRTLKKLEDTANAILDVPQAATPTVCHFDLLKAGLDDYWNLAKQLSDAGDGLDGLVNNASILGGKTPIEQYSPAKWMEVMHVNVNGQFMLTQTCLPLLRRSKDASIVFVSSNVGRKGRAYWGAYAASKFAVEGLMQTLADELAENTAVRVCSLNPGRTRTAMRRAAYPAEDPTTLPTTQDVAPAFIYLLGAADRALHGRALDA